MSGSPAKYGTSGGKLPALSDWAIDRCTPRSLQFEPPAETPFGVARQRPDCSTAATKAAAPAETVKASQSRRRACHAADACSTTDRGPRRRKPIGIGGGHQGGGEVEAASHPPRVRLRRPIGGICE